MSQKIPAASRSDRLPTAGQCQSISHFRKDHLLDVQTICAKSSALKGEFRSRKSSNVFKKRINSGQGNSHSLKNKHLLFSRPNSEISCRNRSIVQRPTHDKIPPKRPIKLPIKLEKPSPCGPIEESDIQLENGVAAVCNPFGCQFRTGFNFA